MAQLQNKGEPAGASEDSPYAVRQGDEATVSRLLDSGCDPNAADDRGSTPLYSALEENQPEILRLILARGADPNALCQGRTPLMEAIEVEALGASDLRRDYDYRTTLLSILLENGADVHAECEGITALQFAQRYGHAPAVALLRSYGADG